MADINLTRKFVIGSSSSNMALWEICNVLTEMLADSEVFELFHGDFSTTDVSNAWIAIRRKGLINSSEIFENHDVYTSLFLTPKTPGSTPSESAIQFSLEAAGITGEAGETLTPSWDEDTYVYTTVTSSAANRKEFAIKLVEHGESALIAFDWTAVDPPYTYNSVDSLSRSDVINYAFSGKDQCVIFMSGPATALNQAVYGDLYRNKIYVYSYIYRKANNGSGSNYLYHYSPCLRDPDIETIAVCSPSTNSKWWSTTRDITTGGIYATFDPYVGAGVTNAIKHGNYMAGYLFDDILRIETITTNAMSAENVTIGDDKYDYVYGYAIKI